MAEILGLGITHYPPLCSPDPQMAGILRRTLEDPSIPSEAKDPRNWPAAMRAEWSDDFGARAAGAHREEQCEHHGEFFGDRGHRQAHRTKQRTCPWLAPRKAQCKDTRCHN